MGISVKCVKVKFLHFAFVLYCLEYQIHRASTGLLNDDPFSTPAMCLSISMLAKLKYVIKTVPTKNPFTPTRKHVLSAVQNSFLHNSCLHWSLSASNLALWKIQVNDRLEIQFLCRWFSFSQNRQHILLVWMGFDLLTVMNELVSTTQKLHNFTSEIQQEFEIENSIILHTLI